MSSKRNSRDNTVDQIILATAPTPSSPVLADPSSPQSKVYGMKSSRKNKNKLWKEVRGLRKDYEGMSWQGVESVEERWSEGGLLLSSMPDY